MWTSGGEGGGELSSVPQYSTDILLITVSHYGNPRMCLPGVLVASIRTVKKD